MSHNPNSALGGQNPDYYAETASLNGPPAHQQYPPPPGPPPNSQQQQHFPPPPPGPPPGGSAPPNASGLSAEQKPALPPRPNSSQGQYFPPPPTAEAHGALPPPPAPPSEEQITSKKSSWGKRFDDLLVKAGKPINKITNKLGSEAFWPTGLEDECAKCARILKSFTVRGADHEKLASTPVRPPPSPGHPTSPGPAKEAKTLLKIPPKVIQNAQGLAIFTTFRTGLHISGAGGSGVVIARLPNGDWSPPSSFLVHTLGWGLMAGADIYDCVCVLNTPEAVAAFTHPRLSLGGEIAVVAGPIGAGGAVEGAVGKSTKPVYSYMRSRGLYGGVQADGTVILQRPDANHDFYKRKVSVQQILAGEVQWPPSAAQLREVARDAEGKKADMGVVQSVEGQTLGDLSPEVHQANLKA
ncbi:DUF500-domain-containing protein [Thozetella sp. PMI_491]|nr:DUF500-domain-containing protein [Thozetella sp. PMI_491]